MLKTVTNSINASQIQTPITLPGNVTLSTGNLIIGTSGKGIDFSATSGTGTSELLADYEEGTWTPVPTDYTEVGGAATWSGTYTKIGRIVHVTMQAIPVTSIASIQGTSYVSGLPFSVFARAVSAWSDDNRNNYGTNAIVVGQTLATSPNITATNSTIFGSATYVAT